MNKKHLSLLLALVLVLGVVLTACGGGEKPAEPTEPTETGTTEGGGEETPATGSDEVVPGSQIIIGNSTELSGDWTPHWQNASSNYEFYLMSRNATVQNDDMGEFHVNMNLLDSYDVEENEDGSKTHIFKIKEDLKWADGSPITAKHFVAGPVFWSTPGIMDMGAPGNGGDKFVGYKEFNAGETNVFSGVRLLDEYTYSFTVNAEELPFFYETTMVGTAPEDINFWTGDDEIEVLDDGEGVYFSKEITKEAHEDAVTKARFALPRPASGAYEIVEYDSTAKMATAKVNPNYVGNFEGKKPKVETIIMKLINADTQLDELKTGSVDILFTLAAGAEINAGLDLVDQGGYNYFKFPRAGYGKLAFQVDFGPTQFVEVRQAIAHLLDRVDFANAFTEGYGSVVNGPYGEGQWMYQESKAALDKELNQYSYNPDEAVRLLEEGGWTKNADGSDYSGTGIRHKEVDGEMMPLIIEWASSENEVAQLLAVKLQENPDLIAAGIKINKTPMTFPEVLTYLARDGGQDPKYAVPTYNMYNLATGFTAAISSFEYSYSTEDKYMGGNYNSNFIRDEELATYVKDMLRVDPEDRDAFKENYVKFLVRWNQLLPDIPLYSNMYHDFYSDRIVEYKNSPYMRNWEVVMYLELAE